MDWRGGVLAQPLRAAVLLGGLTAADQDRRLKGISEC